MSDLQNCRKHWTEKNHRHVNTNNKKAGTYVLGLRKQKLHNRTRFRVSEHLSEEMLTDLVNLSKQEGEKSQGKVGTVPELRNGKLIYYSQRT